MQRAQLTDQEWARQRVAPFPGRWRAQLLRTWEQKRQAWDRSQWHQESATHRAANLDLLDLTARLGGVRIPLEASDAQVCDRARQLADDCAQLAQLFHDADTLRAAMDRKAWANGVEPPNQKIPAMGAIRRMTDPLWWRRGLRKTHAKAVESAAIALGWVNKARDVYVSNESLTRRLQQNRRNAETLEGTLARNELGQEFTLAELAAKGTANKAIRRAELMTRIAGFERIAKDLGHAGLFFTMTCPSRMHKWTTVQAGRVLENPRYDGTSPREAQGYLARVWARIRAAVKRAGLALYGFRIAEPNHDGTPHWHLLLFHPAGALDSLRAIVRRYALADSPNERGADRHRVDFKPIDPARGSAAGYIAKYVAKNIDGFGSMEKDLFGNDILQTSARVEAWAATWGIRQFQQIGGPPVTVWRELRRIEALPEGAPEHLKAAHAAVNKVALIDGRDQASAAWDHYCQAQGGVTCGRDYRIRLATEPAPGIGRYGDPLGDKAVGVVTLAEQTYRDGLVMRQRRVPFLVRSNRQRWEIIGRQRPEVGGIRGAKRPWTRVNNCTQEGANGHRFNGKPNGRPAGGLGESPNRHSIHGRALHGPPAAAAAADH